MKTIIGLLLIIGFTGCVEDIKRKPVIELLQRDYDLKYDIIEIDGCEYIRTYFDRSVSLTHKGNCKNPIHY